MPDIQLKVYPRGFLGATLGQEFRRSTELQQDITGYHLAKVGRVADLNGTNDPNPAVEALYAKAVREHNVTGAFAFRKQVLQTALHAFGPLSFSSWYQAQFANQFAGDMHGRFLEDCMRFVCTGSRSMSLITWTELLQIRVDGEKIGEIGEMAADYFLLPYKGVARHSPRTITVAEAVRGWCSQPQGLDDLLGSLHVLFGAGAS